ncbi:hypothetical protein, partial [Geitlerinema sp. PCC 9228]|uniref:hypothetical protein n=1 Tax=Geitlerinema sp. PCC 9228 TaxID=111611 RepID=UPI001114E1C9
MKYEITGGSAQQHIDYFNSRYRKVSDDAGTEKNGIIIPQGETSGRIYFSALPDELVEGEENVNIRLLPHNFDDEENSSADNSNYNIDSSNDRATITIQDNQAYKNEVILLDGDGLPVTAEDGSGNPLAIRDEKVDFQVKLGSQPSDSVTVTLSSNQGSLEKSSLTFNASNWDKAQSVSLSNVDKEGQITISAGNYLSQDTTFDFVSDAPLKTTEGSEEEAQPVIPEAIVSSEGDITEDDGLSSNFVVNLSAPAPEGGVEIPYEISGEAQPEQDYQKIAQGNALVFDGKDDYVKVPHQEQLNVTEEITVEAYIY